MTCYSSCVRTLPYLLLAALVCSCARTDFVRAPDVFRPLPAGATAAQKQAYFESHRVHIIGPNHGEIAGQAYNANELLRYYDDSRDGDASELQTRAKAKVLSAEDWAFFGTAYGSIAGTLIGGLHAYLTTQVYDFAAIQSSLPGALEGLAWGMLSGMTVGWSALAIERHQALGLQRQAAGEFNHTARSLLKLEVAPVPQGAKAGLTLDY